MEVVTAHRTRILRCPEVGVYKKKTRKHASTKESDQEKERKKENTLSTEKATKKKR